MNLTNLNDMIDPKTLHIGSHVKYYDKIHRVFAIDERKQQVELCVYATNTNRISRSTLCGVESINPIPITAEILTELGFEKVTLQTRPKPIIQYVDAESIKAQAKDLNVRVVPRITIQHINVRNPFWSVSAYGEDMEDNKMAVRYLHELEAFLYLTTKTELIKE